MYRCDLKQVSKQSFNGMSWTIWILSVAITIIFTIASSPWIVVAFQQQQQPYVANTKSSNHKSCYRNNISHVRRDPRNSFIRVPIPNRHRRPLLYLAAGSRSLNKQAALRQKLEQAKQQNFEQQQQQLQQQQQNTTISSSSSSSSSVSGYPLSEKEIRERNDRLRFEELLKKKGGAFIDSENDKEYKTRQQEDEEIDAVRKYTIYVSYMKTVRLFTLTIRTTYVTLFGDRVRTRFII